MWTTRWGAVTSTMAATATRYAQLGQPPGHPQIAVLGQAVDQLQLFADALFNLFFTGFAGGSLAPSSQYPPDYVYACIQEQAQNDLQVLQMAADQRLNAPYSPMLGTLNVADALAQRALTQAQTLLPAGMRAVTYFQKTSSIRVLPYANLALIGIPYSSIDYHPDLLTIPHELGHFIFWHGPMSVAGAPTYQQNLQHQLSMSVRTALSNLSINQLGQTAVATPPFQLFYQWCYVWLEELFADLLGCWVSGPVSALTIQEIVLRRPHSQMVTSDNDHPVGILRPYTHMKVLDARGTADWSACAALLKTHWLENVPDGLSRFNTPCGGDILVQDALVAGWTTDPNRPVDKMVLAIMGTLNQLGCAYDDWRIPTTAPGTAADLKLQFEDFYQSQLSMPLPPLTPPLTGLALAAWADKYFNLSADLRAVLNNTAPTAAVPAEEWWPIAQGRSWTTEPINWPRP